MSEFLPHAGATDEVAGATSLSERVSTAVERNRQLGTLWQLLQSEEWLSASTARSDEVHLDRRLRLATLNLMQDAVDARRAEERQKSERALAHAAYLDRDNQLRLALDVAAIGTFTWNFDSGRLFADERMCALVSLPDEDSAAGDGITQLLRISDADGFDAAVLRARQADGDRRLRGDFAIDWPDGSQRWLSITAQVDFDSSAIRSLRMRGAVLDVTDRRRAQAALRDSERRFQQFAAASSEVLWIRTAKSLQLEFLSTAFESVFGADPRLMTDLLSFGRWLTLVVPDDRPLMLQNVERARSGQPVVHECRIRRPGDGTIRWIRNTDFPLFDEQGNVERIAGIVSDVTDVKQLLEHQGVLVAELQHRVRNIMAMIRAIAVRTGESAQDVQSYSDALTGRLMAIARTQTLLTGAARQGVSLNALVRTELSALSDDDSQFSIRGKDVMLPAKVAEVLTLVVHELTTNAIKYGALAHSAGLVSVRWAVYDQDGEPWLRMIWREQGVKRPNLRKPVRPGFGTELIEQRVPYELRGSGRLSLAKLGARCLLQFPLPQRASVLETDAPERERVSGGSSDMSNDIDLSHRSVLIVEDDFYLARDAARALNDAGATVVGPFPSERQARFALGHESPDCALLDINLGDGPRFDLARLLRERGIPFLFMTGYDRKTIPEEFVDIECLLKPVSLKNVVRSVASLPSRVI